jgi:hypothetical protein
MPIPTNNFVYADGDHTVPVFTGVAVFSNPFPGVASQYRLDQELMAYQWSEFNAAPLPLNTVHPDYPGYYLTAESERSDVGNGLVKWKRTYCQIPAERYEASSLLYLYPGIDLAYTVPGTPTVVPVSRRIPTSIATNARLVYDYYIIDSSGMLPGGYTDFAQIPVITHQKFYYQVFNGLAVIGLGELNPPWVIDASTGFSPATFQVTGGTLPTAQNYLSAQGKPFNVAGAFSQPTETGGVLSGGGLPTGYGWMAANDSQLSRWQGNIFQRITTFIPVV